MMHVYKFEAVLVLELRIRAMIQTPRIENGTWLSSMFIPMMNHCLNQGKRHKHVQLSMVALMVVLYFPIP